MENRFDFEKDFREGINENLYSKEENKTGEENSVDFEKGLCVMDFIMTR